MEIWIKFGALQMYSGGKNGEEFGVREIKPVL